MPTFLKSHALKLSLLLIIAQSGCKSPESKEVEIVKPTIEVVKAKQSPEPEQNTPTVQPAESGTETIEPAGPMYEVYDTYTDADDPFLNMRNGPSPSYDIVYKLKDGDRVELLSTGHGSNEKWMEVYFLPQNIRGFVHERYIRKVR